MKNNISILTYTHYIHTHTHKSKFLVVCLVFVFRMLVSIIPCCALASRDISLASQTYVLCCGWIFVLSFVLWLLISWAFLCIVERWLVLLSPKYYLPFEGVWCNTRLFSSVVWHQYSSIQFRKTIFFQLL